MNKRVFYVINLDRGRIWILATLLVSTLLFAFATGFRVGASRSTDSLNSGLSANGANGEFDGMELAELGPTTGQQDELQASGSGADLEADADSADARNPDAGRSPFEKQPGDSAESRDSMRNAQSGRFDFAESERDDYRRNDSEQRRLAAAREMAKQREARESKTRVTKSEKSKTKTAAKSTRKSKAAAQKNGKALARKKTAKSDKSKQSVASQKSVKSKKSAQRSVAAKRSAVANPRSALLDTDSGKLRMANISKNPATTPAQSAATASRGDASKKSEKSKTPKNSEISQAPRKTYSLQLGAFSSRAAGNRMADTLKKQGFHPYIVESRGKFIVRVGKSDTAKGLWKLETRLRKKQYAPMRVSSQRR